MDRNTKNTENLLQSIIPAAIVVHTKGRRDTDNYERDAIAHDVKPTRSTTKDKTTTPETKYIIKEAVSAGAARGQQPQTSPSLRKVNVYYGM